MAKIIVSPPSGGGNREIIPADNHVARCYQIIDMGTADETYPDGKVKPNVRKISIGFELPNELRVFNPDNGEQPFVVSKQYNYSLYVSAPLRKDLKAWRSKDFTEEEAATFDIAKLMGAPCLLNIIHYESKKGGTYAQIAGITPLPKGTVCPKAINAPEILAFDEWNEKLFEKQPDFIKDRIKSSAEYKEMKNPSTPSVDKTDKSEYSVSELPDEDDLPF
jgi:hypothetical protein